MGNRHGDSVPLHGRLMLQWMHFAFPYECPYPALKSNEIPKDLRYASDIEIASWQSNPNLVHVEQSHEKALSQWLDHEEPLFDPERHARPRWQVLAPSFLVI